MKISILILLSILSVSLADTSCEKGAFELGRVNFRDISVRGENAYFTNNCNGPIEGIVDIDTVTTSLANYGLDWTYDATVYADGTYDGPNTSSLTFISISSVRYSLKLGNINNKLFNTVAVAIQTKSEYGTYVTRCINGDSGTFNSFGIRSSDNDVKSLSLLVAYDTSCDAQAVTVDATADVLDCIDKLKLRINTLESEVTDLREENTQLTAQFGNCEDSLSDQADQIEDLVEEVNGLSGDKQILLTTVAKDAVTIRGLQDSLSTCTTQYNTLLSDYNTTTDDNVYLTATVNDLQSQLNNYKSQLDTSRSQYTDCTTSLTALQASDANLQYQIQSLNDEIASLRDAVSQCSDDSTAALQALNLACQAQIDQYKDTITRLSGNISDLTGQLSGCSSELDTANSNLTSYQAANATLQQYLADAESKIYDLNLSITDLESQITGLQANVDSETKRGDSCENTLRVVTEEFNNSQDDVSNLNNENNALRNAISCRDTNLSEFRQNIDGLIADLASGCAADEYEQTGSVFVQGN
jgi:chromosome segregation ATPase